MLEILEYDFIQNALIAGIFISFAAGIIGSLVVVNKITFIFSISNFYLFATKSQSYRNIY